MNAENDLKIRCLICDKNITLSYIKASCMAIIDFINAYEEKTISEEAEKVIQLGINDTKKSRDQVIIHLIKVGTLGIVSCGPECFKKE